MPPVAHISDPQFAYEDEQEEAACTPGTTA